MKTPTPPPHINPEKSIFLSGAVPSAKNSKMIGFYYKKSGEESSWYFKKNGEFKAITPSLRSSDQTEEYIKDIVQQIIDNKKRFKELVKGMPKPYIIQLHFVRKTKAMFDFGNAVEAIADCISGSYWKKHPKIPMVATQWIDVDDIANVVFIPVMANILGGLPLYSVDKDSPGVWIMPLDIGIKPEIEMEQLDMFADARKEASEREREQIIQSSSKLLFAETTTDSYVGGKQNKLVADEIGQFPQMSDNVKNIFKRFNKLGTPFYSDGSIGKDDWWKIDRNLDSISIPEALEPCDILSYSEGIYSLSFNDPIDKYHHYGDVIFDENNTAFAILGIDPDRKSITIYSMQNMIEGIGTKFRNSGKQLQPE